MRLPNGASPYFFAFGETKLELTTKASNRQVNTVDYQADNNWQFHPDSVLAQRKQGWSKVKQARVVPKQKAVNAYTKIVAQNIDPALMEWSGADVFNCRVFPLMPKKMHHIVIGYDLNLLETDGQYLLQMALGNQKEKTPFRIEALVNQTSIKDLTVSPQVAENQAKMIKGNQKRFTWVNPIKSEIKIEFEQPKAVLLTSGSNQPINYFATTFKANLPKTPKNELKDEVVFLLDVSLSSQPDKFNVWLKTMVALLQNNQDIIKRFSVLCFNIEAFWWKQRPVANTRRNLRRFIRFASKLSLEGATDLGAALDEVKRASWLKNQSKYLFLLSDGDVTWGENNLYRLSKKVAKIDELYAFSTGFSGTDPRILDHLTRSSNGAVFSIVNEDEVQQVSQNFRYEPWRIEQIEMAGANDFVLAGRPQYLYANQKVILAGRQQKLSNPNLKISVSQLGKKETLAISFNSQLKSELAKRVYGQIATVQLEELGYLTEKEAIQYAVHYRVPGQTCSFVMLESERDYHRFNIKKEDNTKFISENTVQLVLNQLPDGNTNQLGNAKSEFLHFLEKLKKGEGGAKITSYKNLKALIDQMSVEAFEVNSPVIKAKRHTTRGMSADLLANLQSGNVDYELFQKTATKRKRRNKSEAIRLLSSLIEKNAGNVNQLRDVGFSAMKWGMPQHTYFIFKKLIDLRPYQPPSYQLIAQALDQMGKPELAMLYYELVLGTKWDDWKYDDFRLITTLDYLRFLRKMTSNTVAFSKKTYAKKRISDLEELVKREKHSAVNKDLLVYITWNTDNTYVDLFIKEPSKKVCSYNDDRTENGVMTEDVEGLGPVLYYADKAEKGRYEIRVNYYNQEWQRVSTKTRVYIEVYRNWGKKNEKVIRRVITLNSKDENDEEIVSKMQRIAKVRF